MSDPLFDDMIDQLKTKLSGAVQHDTSQKTKYKVETSIRAGDIDLVMTLSLELREARTEQSDPR